MNTIFETQDMADLYILLLRALPEQRFLDTATKLSNEGSDIATHLIKVLEKGESFSDFVLKHSRNRHFYMFVKLGEMSKRYNIQRIKRHAALCASYQVAQANGKQKQFIEALCAEAKRCFGANQMTINRLLCLMF